jgi:hypothetical protein
MNNQTKNQTVSQTQTIKAQRLADLINDIVSTKGTCFAGFTYNGKRRNVTLGANLASRTHGGTAWGQSYANGALVKHKQNIYIQGIPNNDESNAGIKRFNLADVQDFVIG